MLYRAYNIGYTPIASANSNIGYENNSEVRSIIGSIFRNPIVRRGILSRSCLKELDTFKRKTLKEARDFIRSLKLIFALTPKAYSLEYKKILYSIIFLIGEPYKI
jgi:hypothetical protein